MNFLATRIARCRVCPAPCDRRGDRAFLALPESRCPRKGIAPAHETWESLPPGVHGGHRVAIDGRVNPGSKRAVETPEQWGPRMWARLHRWPWTHEADAEGDRVQFLRLSPHQYPSARVVRIGRPFWRPTRARLSAPRTLFFSGRLMFTTRSISCWEKLFFRSLKRSRFTSPSKSRFAWIVASCAGSSWKRSILAAERSKCGATALPAKSTPFTPFLHELCRRAAPGLFLSCKTALPAHLSPHRSAAL